jgi:hypothetical protein
MAVKPIPDGYSSVTPYLIVSGAAKALDYYKKASTVRTGPSCTPRCRSATHA